MPMIGDSVQRQLPGPQPAHPIGNHGPGGAAVAGRHDRREWCVRARAEAVVRFSE